MQSFVEKLHLAGQELSRRTVNVLQVNMGRYCNLACIHCHVESGPTRKEMMSRETVDAVLRFLATTKIPTVDITGGAPELHRDFDYLVEAARCLGRHVMDRCNLTVIFEPGKDYLPEYFKRHQVELVCSLPCYSEENVDKQRGKGTFEASIRALQVLNEIGYGQPGSDLVLNLVYNPVGPHLPPPQASCRRYTGGSPRKTLRFCHRPGPWQQSRNFPCAEDDGPSIPHDGATVQARPRFRRNNA